MLGPGSGDSPACEAGGYRQLCLQPKRVLPGETPASLRAGAGQRLPQSPKAPPSTAPSWARKGSGSVGRGWPQGAPAPPQAPLRLPAPRVDGDGAEALKQTGTRDSTGHAAGSDGMGTPRLGAGWLPQSRQLHLCFCSCAHPGAGGRRGCGARGPRPAPPREPALLTLVLSEGSISFPARLCFSALISQTIATHKGKGTARMPGVWRARQEH